MLDSCPMTTSSIRFFESPTSALHCPYSDPHQLAKPRVLIPQLLGFLRFAHIHPATPPLPGIDGALRHSALSSNILCLPACLHLLQRSDDLRLRVFALRPESALSKYDFIFGCVRFSGSRSKRRVSRFSMLESPLPLEHLARAQHARAPLQPPWPPSSGVNCTIFALFSSTERQRPRELDVLYSMLSHQHREQGQNRFRSGAKWRDRFCVLELAMR